jgi:hypothetical protein
VTYAEYGPLLLSTDLDQAATDVLKTWMPTYLMRFEEERHLAIGSLPRPQRRSYQTVLDDDEFPDQTLPGIFVTSSGTTTVPVKDADGNYYGAWTLNISAVARGQTPSHARVLSSYYEGCIRRIMLHQCLPFDSEVRLAAVPMIGRVTDRSGRNRHLNAAVNRFTVYVDHVVQAGVGPTIPNGPYPDPDPANPQPTEPFVPVTTVTTDLQIKR